MIKLFYKWRYQRAQRAGSFSLPKQQGHQASHNLGLSSYLQQDSVRGRNYGRLDLPHQRKRGLKLLMVLLVILLLGWVAYESYFALAALTER